MKIACEFCARMHEILEMKLDTALLYRARASAIINPFNSFYTQLCAGQVRAILHGLSHENSRNRYRHDSVETRNMLTA